MAAATNVRVVSMTSSNEASVTKNGSISGTRAAEKPASSNAVNKASILGA